MSTVQNIVENFVTEIRTALREEIATDLMSERGPAMMAERAQRLPSANGTPTKRKAQKPASPALKKARQLQGQYLGGTRRLNKKQRAQVKSERTKNGVESALKMIAKLAPAKK